MAGRQGGQVRGSAVAAAFSCCFDRLAFAAAVIVYLSFVSPFLFLFFVSGIFLVPFFLYSSFWVSVSSPRT